MDGALPRSHAPAYRGPAERTLFVTHCGRPFNPDALSRLVSRYVSSGPGRPGACHIFRHAMATAMLDHGADIRYIQEMLGHASSRPLSAGKETKPQRPNPE